MDFFMIKVIIDKHKLLNHKHSEMEKNISNDVPYMSRKTNTCCQKGKEKLM